MEPDGLLYGAFLVGEILLHRVRGLGRTIMWEARVETVSAQRQSPRGKRQSPRNSSLLVAVKF